MKRPLEGVKVVEVAQFTFVPSSGAVLAEWGADVIKIEHAVTGDAQRGLVSLLGLKLDKETTFFPIMEGPNRAKRSLGLALEVPEGRALLDELIKDADVFVTNFTPSARKKLKIEIPDVRAVNPNIIYVRGTAYGARGSVANEGGYDGTAFWARAGCADSATPLGADMPINQPTGAFGDSLGGMTIAGGIAAALYGRAVSGEPSVVDVNLLGVGAWATQFSVNLALQAGGPLPKPPVSNKPSNPSNPLTGTFKLADGRFISLVMLQPTRYWPEFCERMGRPELITDPRFAGEEILKHGIEGGEIVADILSKLTLDEWKKLWDGAEGQWSPIQNTFEVGNDPALIENGFIADVEDADGVMQKLITNPVQFDETPVATRRAPQFAEHTDEILREMGKTEEQLIELKIAGAIT